MIGYPLGHSFSKGYFNQKFQSEGIDAEYVNFEIADVKLLMEIISETPNLSGLNVTIPYKEQVIPLLDEIDEDAKKIGAVNVIKIIHGRQGLKLKGYNSDVIGFCDSIKELVSPSRNKALILGTGGAAKAICYGLEKMGVATQLVSRHKSARTLTYEELTKADIAGHKIIVNTTPLGMYPHTENCPDIPYRFLTKDHVCYDLLYNPDETLFMKKGKEQGATVKNGLEMLLLQAFAAWEIWQK